ncbi:MAG: hypothetical protein ACRDSE_16575 [Pseudonocardiaceae bacterium]
MITPIRPAPIPITAECFPTPGLVLRTNDPTAQQHVREFAHRHADAAISLHRMLVKFLRTARGNRARAAVFITAFDAAEDWRFRVAAASSHQTGRYGADHTERFRTPITDDNTNLFRIGEHARFREGATWDPDTRTYVGGAETPASRTMRQIGDLAALRFAKTSGADVLCNPVTLPDGAAARGVRLLRGTPARHAATELVVRIAARGGDTSRVITDGDLLYTASAPEVDRRKIFHGAMALLAGNHIAPSAALTAWLRAAYLLYQAPRRKRGSDATIRTFLVAAGSILLRRPPILLHDTDLRAYVQPQHQFVTELRAGQDGTSARS